MLNVHADDLWKLAGVLGGALVFMASGHLPHVLAPYKETIETAAFIWTTIQAQRMIPPGAIKESGK
jgi:hypothetical protein